MHFTSSFVTGAVVALYATQIAAAPVSSRSSLLGARATEGCDGDPARANDQDYYRCLSVPAEPVKPINPELLKPNTAKIPAGTKLEPVAAPAPAPVTKKQAKRHGDKREHHHPKRATEGCEGDPAHANDPNYYRCLSVPAEEPPAAKPEDKKPAPKAGKPVKPNTKVAAKVRSEGATIPEPQTPEGELPTGPGTKKPVKPNTKVAAEEAPAATPEQKPQTPLERTTRNRLPVSQMEDGGRP